MEAVYAYRSNWWGFIGKRVLIAILVFLLTTLLIFFGTRMIFSDVQIMFGTNLVDFFWTTEEEHAQVVESIEQLRNEKGLNGPYLIQYFRWMGGIFTGDWGESLMGSSYYLK